MRLVAAAALLAGGSLLVAGCGSSSSGGARLNAGNSTSPTSSPTARSASGCSPVPTLQQHPQQFAHEPPLTIARTTYTAVVTTNCGKIVVKLDGKHAPNTVNSFAFLAKKHFFDDTPCHRLTTSGIYVLQCGDPTGTGSGGPGYTIPDENLAGATYPAGTVAMANAGPNTGGSQFFFVYQDTQLNAAYTPFGRVVSGMGVLQRIAAAGSTPPGDGRPNQPVAIETFRVTKG